MVGHSHHRARVDKKGEMWFNNTIYTFQEMPMKLLQKILDGGFLFLLGAFLLAGLVKTAFFPKELNTYENRYANALPVPTVGTVLDCTFQDGVEDALSDQVLLAQTCKKAYNMANSALQLHMLSGFIQSNPDRYIKLLGLKTFGGENLVYDMQPFPSIQQALEERAQSLNALMRGNPGPEYYAYYIEKDSDMDFETGEKSGAYELLQARLDLPAGHMARLEMDGFDTYREYFYKTDHHWNYKGSYQGYTQVAKLLGVDEPLLLPQEEKVISHSFSGSKAAGMGAKDTFVEDFTAYRFRFPPMEVWHDGEPAGDYGSQEAYLAGAAALEVEYGYFYGGDWGQLVLDTGREGRGNLLVIGESYDNAILKLLASHFHKTYSIDLRNYEKFNGGPFSFSQYLQEHDVQKVLFNGSIGFYTSSELLPGS